MKKHLHLQADAVGNTYVAARRIIESNLQATKMRNPNDPAPMEVDAVKARGKGKKGKDTAKSKGKSRRKGMSSVGSKER